MANVLKQIVGTLLIDWLPYEWRLQTGWSRICNRNERLLASSDGRGVACQWQWTSDLHIAKIFPRLGTRLMRRALRDWPIAFCDAPSHIGEPIQVSFVIGHRGMHRLPHLLATLATIAAQRDVVCECIVVEQSAQIEIKDHLPPWVRHVHTPLPDSEMPYCRSWTLNVGARCANGELLIFHDNDLLLSGAYAAESWARYQEGFEVINLKRFIFYLNESFSAAIQLEQALNLNQPPEVIMQNAEAGGSIAISKDAFFAIGGYDESFVGWGGEDNEFWERAQTRRVWPYGYLPLVHLWHPPQPQKSDAANPTFLRWIKRSQVAPSERIAELARRPFGDLQTLSGRWPNAT